MCGCVEWEQKMCFENRYHRYSWFFNFNFLEKLSPRKRNKLVNLIEKGANLAIHKTLIGNQIFEDLQQSSKFDKNTTSTTYN